MNSRTVLITGATSGIGFALYEKYTAQGDNVIACGRDKNKLQKLCTKAFKNLVFDMTEPAQVESVSVDIEEIDILILNAGDCKYIDDAKHFDGKMFSDIISTNLSSLGALLQFFLPLVKKGGQVVFVSSSATIVPFPRSEAYGASKAGMDYLANSLRLDLVCEDIGVTLVHPGFIKTPLTDKNTFEMPFLLSSEEAASRIFTGINRRAKYLHFPRRLTVLLKVFSLLPSSLWQSIILRK
jgi:NAD(P)-dependent dehydrogenase (short-subunit alcohol dehydrogenase family)